MAENISENSELKSGQERPLLSFLLLSYNQEQFIREAVAGAFAQTYSPLEIIISDDCSTDSTFEIICEMANKYSGPHLVILNQNQRNLGIGAHINHAMELVNGELIVGGAGDDVSVPERSSVMYEAWQASGGRAFSLFSEAVVIDEHGKQLKKLYGDRIPGLADSVEDAVRRGGVGVAGCTHAFSRKTFDFFGRMDNQTMAEDMVIPFRSLLLGDIHYINTPLVLYRTHGGNISMESSKYPSLKKRCLEKDNLEAVMLTWIQDVRLACVSGLLSEERATALKITIINKMREAVLEGYFFRHQFVSGLSFLLKSVFSVASFLFVGKSIERRLRSR